LQRNSGLVSRCGEQHTFADFTTSFVHHFTMKYHSIRLSQFYLVPSNLSKLFRLKKEVGFWTRGWPLLCFWQLLTSVQKKVKSKRPCFSLVFTQVVVVQLHNLTLIICCNKGRTEVSFHFIFPTLCHLLRSNTPTLLASRNIRQLIKPRHTSKRQPTRVKYFWTHVTLFPTHTRLHQI
jgi:hypothetical protein